MTDTKHLNEDERVLHEMGYAQELSRRMGPFQSFAISFSIICIISGGLASFPIALSTGGPWMATIGWVLGGLFAWVVAASLGQIASAYPTAGSLYHWSSILGGRFWGWLTALINLLGLLFVIPAVNVILYTFTKDLFFAGMLGWDVSTWGTGTMLTFVAVITALQCLLNHFGIKLTTMLTDFSGYLIMATAALLTLILFSKAPSFDLGSAFEWRNTTGAAGGGVAPAYGWFMTLLMGMLYPLFTITGFDASAHTSEETVDARNTVHKGMMNSVFWSLIAGFIMVLAMTMALPAVYTTLAADPAQTTLSKEVMDTLGAIPGGPKPADMAILGWGAFTTLFNTLVMPSFLGKLVALGIIIANFCCALSAITSTSRMTYAFARDGGLPRFLAKVDPQYRTPQAAIWFSGIVSFLLTWVTTPLGAFVALSTGCAVYLYVSYLMPILAGIFAEGKTWTNFGSFRLGAWSKLFGWISVLGVALATIGGHAFVPSIAGDAAAGTSFVPGLWYYSLGYLALCALMWFGFANSTFKGPPTGDEIKKRQADIESRERSLSGGSMSTSTMAASAATAAVATAAVAKAAAPSWTPPAVEKVRDVVGSMPTPAAPVMKAPVVAAPVVAAPVVATPVRVAAAPVVAKTVAAKTATKARTVTAKKVVAKKAVVKKAAVVKTVKRAAPAIKSVAVAKPVAVKAAVKKVAKTRDMSDEAARARLLKSAHRGIKGEVKPVLRPVTTTIRRPMRADEIAASTTTQYRTVSTRVIDPRDDISLISGVGNVIKKQLAGQGITRLSQIASMSKADLAKLDAKMNFRGRTEREDWIAQAKELVAGGKPRAKSDRERS